MACEQEERAVLHSDPSTSMRIVIPGGSGFLGRSFATFARKRGYHCIVLTRNPRDEGDVQWDGRTMGDWAAAFDGAAAVVNFTGRSVNCVYNDANKKEIIESRVNSVRAVDEAVAGCSDPPKVIVQAGSLAIYGDTTEPCGEDAPHGEGFGVEVCEVWEEEFFAQALPQTRKCFLRIGFVLGIGGGALEPLRTLTRCYLGGTVGKGNQFISWIHIDDLNRMILTCIENASLEGVFNATGPGPVTNRVFMKAMRKAAGRPWVPPAPAPLVRLGARLIMQTDASLALAGRKCFPRRFSELGFVFNHTNLEQTLRDIMEGWG